MKHLLGAGLLVLALLICLPVPGFSANGKLRFYVDRDNDGGYDAGEAVANGTGVTYIKYNSNTLTWTWTDANGCIDYSGAKKDDKLFCKYLAYAQAAWKGQRGFAGSAFDLYMDSDNVSGDGSVDRRKLSTAEANLVNAGNTAKREKTGEAGPVSNPRQASYACVKCSASSSARPQRSG